MPFIIEAGSNFKYVLTVVILAVLAGWRVMQLTEDNSLAYQASQIQHFSWNIYSDQRAGFTFKYPRNWEITENNFYGTAGGTKSEKPTIVLQEIMEENSNNWIKINPKQFQCDLGECVHIEDNVVATYSEITGIKNIFNQICSSFRSIE
jgi:hypothetical protein